MKRQRLRGLLLGAVLLGSIGWLQYSGVRTILDLHTALSEEARIDAQIQTVQEENRKIEAEIDRLENDDLALEEKVREKLLYTREGEVLERMPGKK